MCLPLDVDCCKGGVTGGVVVTKVRHSVMEFLHLTCLWVARVSVLDGFSLIAVLLGGE